MSRVGSLCRQGGRHLLQAVSLASKSLTSPSISLHHLLSMCVCLCVQISPLYETQSYGIRPWNEKGFIDLPFSWGQFENGEELQQLMKWVEKFLRACPHWLWGSEVDTLLGCDPDYMKVILGRSGESKTWYGLLWLNGQMWFQHWRMLTPDFHYDTLKPYMGLMGKWEGLISQDSHLDIFGHVSMMTLDAIMKYAVSHQGSVKTDRDSQSYIQVIGHLNNLVFPRMRNVFIQNDIIYRLTPDGCWSHQACQLAQEHTDQGIKLRMSHLQKEGELEKFRRKKRHLDFLDILLIARMANVSSHDTTASGISWILYALVTHPEHQQRFWEEIQSLLWDGASISWNHLDHLSDTTMCIKEALQLFPWVPGIGTELSKPLNIPDGCSLPRGLTIVLSFYALHHNPEVFDPSRMVLGPAQYSHAFPPFSGGSRNCIGKQFAMNDLNVAVALTLLHFELSPDPSRVPAPIPRIMLKSTNGIHLHLRKLL
uniref:Uncharacterized protein n=1 Tax=Equus asinus TaxID=9793 RepID=A0A8C4M5I2_EQUAS